MKTITYEGVQHGDWVRCVLCGAQMLLPCGADKCPECGENGPLYGRTKQSIRLCFGISPLLDVVLVQH